MCIWSASSFLAQNFENTWGESDKGISGTKYLRHFGAKRRVYVGNFLVHPGQEMDIGSQVFEFLLTNILLSDYSVLRRYLTFLDDVMEAAFLGNPPETEPQSEKAIKQPRHFIFCPFVITFL